MWVTCGRHMGQLSSWANLPLGLPAAAFACARLIPRQGSQTAIAGWLEEAPQPRAPLATTLAPSFAADVRRCGPPACGGPAAATAGAQPGAQGRQAGRPALRRCPALQALPRRVDLPCKHSGGGLSGALGPTWCLRPSAAPTPPLPAAPPLQPCRLAHPSACSSSSRTVMSMGLESPQLRRWMPRPPPTSMCWW